MVVDRDWSVIGSPNLNYRSRQLDDENALGILDRAFAEQPVKTFVADVGQSDEITLDHWSRRNLFLRPAQWLARIFEKQF